jgi:hypothetical protein
MLFQKIGRHLVSGDIFYSSSKMAMLFSGFYKSYFDGFTFFIKLIFFTLTFLKSESFGNAKVRSLQIKLF